MSDGRRSRCGASPRETTALRATMPPAPFRFAVARRFSRERRPSPAVVSIAKRARVRPTRGRAASSRVRAALPAQFARCQSGRSDVASFPSSEEVARAGPRRHRDGTPRTIRSKESRRHHRRAASGCRSIKALSSGPCGSRAFACPDRCRLVLNGPCGSHPHVHDYAR